MGGTTTGGMSANPLFGNKALEKSFHLGNRSVTENSADISMITLFFLLLESRRFFFSCGISSVWGSGVLY